MMNILLLMSRNLCDWERTEIEKLYKRMKKKMFFIALDILRDNYHAEDGVSRAFLIISKNFDRISKLPVEEQEPYCITILKNECYKIYNSIKKYVTSEEFEEILWEEGENTTEEKVFDILDKEKMSFLIENLEGEERDLINLRYGKDWNFKEIGDYFGISDATARKRHQRILEKLRSKRESENYEKDK